MRIYFALVVFVAAMLPAGGQPSDLPYIFTTFVGLGGSSGSADGLGSEARLNRPWGLTIDRDGNLTFTESANHLVRRVTPSGSVTTLAGRAGISGWANGSGSTALFGGTAGTPPSVNLPSTVPTGPFGITQDGASNFFILDANFQVIRQLTSTNLVSNYAGTNQIASHLDGPVAFAQFKVPLAITLLPDGALLVADTFNHVLRQISVNGIVSTLAGIPGVAGSRDGPSATSLFLHPCAVAVSSTGIIYATDANNLVRRLTPSASVPRTYTVTSIAGTPLAGGSTDGVGAAARFGPPPETLTGTRTYVSGLTLNPGLSGAGTALYAISGLPGLAVDDQGNVLVTDHANHTIRQVSPTGLVTTIGGQAVNSGRVDGVGPNARFSNPAGIVVGADGTLYIADAGNHTIRKGTRVTRPSILAAPADRSVAVGTGTTFTVMAAALPAPSYQWMKNQTTIAGATSNSLSFANVTTDHAGAYAVVVANDYGSTVTLPATLSVVTTPLITAQPIGGVRLVGESITLSVAVEAGPGTTFQWLRNDIPVVGATSARLTLTNIEALTAGTYTVIVTNLAGSTTSAAAIVTLKTSKIINLSVRSAIATGQTLTVGFVVAGTGKPLLIRAVGPGLRPFGLSSVLPDPTLVLYGPRGAAGSSDNWGETALAPQIATVAQSVGAFALPAASLDAAILTTAGNSALTVQAADKNSAGGIVLLELYDSAPENDARLINVSTRTSVGNGDAALVAGFVIAGTVPRKILLRAIGPTLASFGVLGTLADPKLDVFAASSSVPIASNDNWAGTFALTTAFTTVGAFPLPSGASKDAALLLTLDPGTYSAQVSGLGSSTGEVLLEIYEHP